MPRHAPIYVVTKTVDVDSDPAKRVATLAERGLDMAETGPL